ncbi:MAG: polymer-forming cytoskeletal protein [Rhodospirillales bacterium]|nr:polymer-forming cytoskeletal protein [Rhodospirillales bacterium]
MFRRKKNEEGDSANSANSANSAQEADRNDSSDDNDKGGAMSAPPLKPFSRHGSHAPAKPPSQPFRAEQPRRTADIPRRGSEIPSRPVDRGSDDGGKKLLVGRDICLHGEITACDRLIVEGTVNAELSDARFIEVLPSGVFNGKADVEEADISGRFEGELTVRGKLTLRSSGRINGKIRYGTLVVEAGGAISGTVETLPTRQTTGYQPTVSQPAKPAEEDGADEG